MKKVAFCLFITGSLCAQSPLIKQWDKRFGGTKAESHTSLIQTSDNGFLIGGVSYSDADGDKTQNNWDALYLDSWVVKTDSAGNKLWDKDFGGTKGEFLVTQLETEDGDYLFCSSTSSDSSGDISQLTRGMTDFWILKTDTGGTKIWDKRYGGSGNDVPYCVDKTLDGGFVLGGSSNSPISGDKSQASQGGEDYWVIKVNSVGNKIWDRRFGGAASDILISIHFCKDGGYILGGYSYSGVGGDKSQLNWSGGSQPDYWVVKVDSSGNKEWDKTFGGTGFDELTVLEEAVDGGFILGGISKSGISGDKTLANWDASNSTFDFWVIKIDSVGNKQWEKVYGGVADEFSLRYLSVTKDRNYFLAGLSYSNISGNKTENNAGPTQAWSLKIDSVGNILWDKTVFSAGQDGIFVAYDFGVSCLQTSDGCFMVATFSSADTGGYKTQNCWDTANFQADYWIVKLCDTTSALGFNDLKRSNYDIAVYPNPFSNEISITLPDNFEGNIKTRLINMLGQTLCSSEEKTDNSVSLKRNNLEDIPAGMYLLQIIINEVKIVKKVIKQ
jgi:hypothetical protein